MRLRALVLAVFCALIGAGTATATAASASTTTSGAAMAKPAGYAIVSATFSLPAGRQTSGSVVCPVKNGVHTVPFSGGVLIQTDSLVASINSSYPTTNGWAASVNNAAAASEFTVYAVCAKKPTGYQLRSSTVSNPADTQSSAGLACPKGKVLLGGGAVSSSSSLIVAQTSSYPESTTAWFVTVNNPTTPSASFTMFVVCAKLNLAKISYQIVAPPATDNPAGQETATEATCPKGLSVLAGGLRSNGGFGVSTNSSFPFPGGWIGDESNDSTSDASVDTLVICAT